MGVDVDERLQSSSRARRSWPPAAQTGCATAPNGCPSTRDVVHRFVPGETVDDALAAVAALRDSDRLVSIDYLGEDVTDVDAAEATVKAYLRLLDALG